ncbi:MAG: LysM peptidoglycan-binding domain-containing protein [Anaerolineae bacterium]|nr:LysM peptidoglycan-binding domain-containing protein [Anaerolineae bacterium]
MQFLKNPRRLMSLALALAVLASLTLGSATGLAVATMDVIQNGDFESGFVMIPGCGMVGANWGCFTNGGSAAYGFYDDQWAPVVANGLHSQLIEINTKQYAASEPDRFAGIYQSVALTRGATYTLKMQGGMREHQPDPFEEKFRYRVQWGYTTDGSTDWTKVTNWVELPWDKIDDRLNPTGLQSFSTSFVAPNSHITLFIRAWKKWGTPYRELDVNIDAVSLTGQVVQHPVQPANPVVVLPGPAHPSQPGPQVLPPGPSQPEPQVLPPAPLQCGGGTLLPNGDFESGFTNGVGNGWASFNNGGSAAYGFYDEMWTPVIKDGAHGQLIEINTWGLAASEPDRFAGIRQTVGGLTAGATYEVSAWGMIREESAHPNEDKFRYRVQWGYAAADADPSEADITNWTELPWDTIYVRTAPGSMSSFSARFAAPSSNVVIAFRAWKKWGTAQRELNVNLDAIKLVACGTTGGGGVIVKPPIGVVPPIQLECYYVVQAGDTLAAIAAAHGATEAELAAANGIRNPNILLLGQRLVVPCKGGGAKPPAGGTCTWYVVQGGDTLSKIAAKYGSTVQAIAQRNNLRNVNLIYVGQRLCIP